MIKRAEPLFKEMSLLAWAVLIFLIGTAILELQKPALDMAACAKELLFAAGIFVFQIIVRFINKEGDTYLFPLIMALCGIGMVLIYRLAPKLFFMQMQWVVLGVFIFCLSSIFFRRLGDLIHYKYLIGLIGVVLLLSAIIFGTEIGGSKSWIILGPIRFQPSEFAKLCIIFFLGAYLVEHKRVLATTGFKLGPFSVPSFRFIAPLIAIWSLAVLMFLLQRDLGSALLFFGIAVSMTYMANGNLSYVAIAGLFFSLSSVISYFLFSHVRVRVAIWQNPWLDPNGQAYQIVQSLVAIGSGGILGTGLGLGNPDYIPEVHTDFIFAAAAEELGLAGACAIILIYILIVYRGYRISLAAKNEMEMLVAAGITSCMALQVFTIIAGVTKLIPLTGITMPFISYGGSSIVVNFIMAGLLFALSGKRQ
jgi:cell division protein FtsW (lipid II flippase)